MEKGKVIQIRNDVIFKSNKLIEVEFLDSKFSVNEYKIINYFISKIGFGDKDFRTFEVDVNELNENFGISGNATYNQLKHRYMAKLLSKNFMIKDGTLTRAYNWFSFIESNRGIFKVCFNEDLKEFLLDDFWEKGYTKFNVSNIVNLKSFFSIRVYELLKQYQKFKVRTFKTDELKGFLGIKGKYDTYSNFKKRVLNTVIKELNEKTDIKVMLVENKIARNVESITFHISKNTKNLKKMQSKDIEDKSTELLYRLKKLYSIDMDHNNMNELVRVKGYEFVKRYVDNFQEFLDNHNMKYKHKFFYAAVLNEWTPTVKNCNSVQNSKPEQATNFEQREYDDEFFDNLYDNF